MSPCEAVVIKGWVRATLTLTIVLRGGMYQLSDCMFLRLLTSVPPPEGSPFQIVTGRGQICQLIGRMRRIGVNAGQVIYVNATELAFSDIDCHDQVARAVGLFTADGQLHGYGVLQQANGAYPNANYIRFAEGALRLKFESSIEVR